MTSMIRSLRQGVSAAILIPTLSCASNSKTPAARPQGSERGDSGATSTSLPAPTPADTNWLTADSAGKTATLDLEVTRPAAAPSALLNGSRQGQARIVVPVGWTVQWSWRNSDPKSPHSLVVMVQREKLPLEGGRPAFSNAMTRMVAEGLAAGGTDQTTFLAEEAGWYWLMCGVPGHALEGEWLELRVDPEATTASVKVKNEK
jgi:hypothetical protein